MAKVNLFIDETPSIAMTLIGIALVLGIGAVILEQMQTTTGGNEVVSAFDSNIYSPNNGTALVFGDYDSQSRLVSCSDVNIYRVE